MTDGPETPETSPSPPTAKGPKVWPLLLLPLPIVALVLAFGLWTTIRGDSVKPAPTPNQAKAPGGGSVDSSLAAIAVQQSDLPSPSIRCDFSGDVQTYIQRLKDAGSGSYESVAQTWLQLQEKGATAGYMVFWGDAQPACDSIISSSNTMDHSGGNMHPSLTFSLVVRYQTPENAEAAYSADIFGQTKLTPTPTFEVTTGAETGLGPNSVVGFTRTAPIPLHQAIWQNSTVTVFYGSENIPLDKSKQVTESVNRRIKP